MFSASMGIIFILNVVIIYLNNVNRMDNIHSLNKIQSLGIGHKYNFLL
jgi:hypothetical protein